jgi:hypothetical protein
VTKPGVTPRLIWTNQYTAAGLTMTRTHANIGDGTPGGSVSVEAGLMDMLNGTQTKECERRTKAVINARRGGNNDPRQYGDHHLLGRNYHRIYQAGTGRLHPSVEGGPGQFTAAWRYLGGRDD